MKRKLQKVMTAEPVTGYRVWRISQPSSISLNPQTLELLSAKWERGENPFKDLLKPKLTGVGYHVPWEGPIIDASCTAHGHSSHRPPARNCGCGIWAMKTEDQVLTVLKTYGLLSSVAFGSVKLWGRWYEHKLGYRAEHAMIEEVTVVHHDKKVADAIRDFYRCKVAWKSKIAVPEVTEADVMLAAARSWIWNTTSANFTGTVVAPNFIATSPGSIITSAGGYVPNQSDEEEEE